MAVITKFGVSLALLLTISACSSGSAFSTSYAQWDTINYEQIAKKASK